jgi:hypothetical protein
MAVNKGGRGLKAPYDTTHVRVPVPIKDKVQQIIDDYKNGTNSEASDTMEYEQVLELAKTILSQKKSAKVSLEKLLTGIYNKKVTL